MNGMMQGRDTTLQFEGAFLESDGIVDAVYLILRDSYVSLGDLNI